MAKKLSKEQWDLRITESLGDKAEFLGWSSSDTFGAKSKCKFRCAIDDFEWETTPPVIMRGGGCPKCAGNIPDRESWEAKIANVLRDVAVFVRWVDIKNTTARGLAEMQCLTCGCKWSSEAHRLSGGRGCPKCAGHLVSQSEWEERIRGKLGASATMVGWQGEHSVGSKSRVVLKCNRHYCGHEWSAVVNEVMRGSGCPKCAAYARRIPEQTQIDVINASGKIKFIEWVGEYKGQKSKAAVRCMVDGHQWTSSISSLVDLKTGCPKCAGNRRYTKQEREDQIASNIGVSFVRWKSSYRNHRSRAVVKCDYGHEWEAQVGTIVYGGCGCPTCAKHGFNVGKKASTYVLISECGGFVKIGISNDATYRLARLAKATPFKFEPIEIFKFEVGKDARDLEREAHSMFASAGFSGFDGATEWLKYTPELADWISKLRRMRGSNAS